MELAASETVSAQPSTIQFTRNAWLVNLLTLIALSVTISFVSFLRMQADAEMYVLIGVAGSAYAVLQGWTLILCARALRIGPAFLSPYFALMVSMGLLNACILSIHTSQALSIHPLREEMRLTALPVLMPVFTVALLITLPLGRWISSRRIHQSEKSRRVIHFSILGASLMLLTPLPLFVYLAQTLDLNEPPTASTSVLNDGWKFVLRATPETVANTALAIGQNSRWHDDILRSGRPSADLLLHEIHPSLRPQAALSGLRAKDTALAVKTAADFARTSGRPIAFAWSKTVAQILAAEMTLDELEAFAKDPEVQSEYRDAVLQERFPASRYQDLSEQERSAAAVMMRNVLAAPSIEMGQSTLSAYTLTNSMDEIQQAWSRWILEVDRKRAHNYARLIGALRPKYRTEFLVLCMKDGSSVMQFAVEDHLAQDRTRFPSDENRTIVRAMLQRMEKDCYASIQGTKIIQELSGVRALACRKGVYSELEFQAYFASVRAFLDPVPPTPQKNSASQAVPSE